jgi:hypothetical protein
MDTNIVSCGLIRKNGVVVINNVEDMQAARLDQFVELKKSVLSRQKNSCVHKNWDWMSESSLVQIATTNHDCEGSYEGCENEAQTSTST